MSEPIDIGIARKARSLADDLEAARSRIAELEGVLAKDSLGRLSVERDLTPHGYKCGFHLRVVVDEESPHVECAICKTPLDPWSVLLEYARKERNFCYALESLQKEKKSLHESVEKLKAQRSRLRTQVRKLGGAPVDDPFAEQSRFLVIPTFSNVKAFDDESDAFAHAEQKAKDRGQVVYVARLIRGVKSIVTKVTV